MRRSPLVLAFVLFGAHPAVALKTRAKIIEATKKGVNKINDKLRGHIKTQVEVVALQKSYPFVWEKFTKSREYGQPALKKVISDVRRILREQEGPWGEGHLTVTRSDGRIDEYLVIYEGSKIKFHPKTDPKLYLDRDYIVRQNDLSARFEVTKPGPNRKGQVDSPLLHMFP